MSAKSDKNGSVRGSKNKPSSASRIFNKALTRNSKWSDTVSKTI